MLAVSACALAVAWTPGAAGSQEAPDRAGAGLKANAALGSCGKQARGATRRRRSRCASLRRVTPRAPLAERLGPVGTAPGGGGGGSGGGAIEAPLGEPGGGGTTTPALGRFVSVGAREWSLTLSRPVVGTGWVTVELRNNGEDPHNLVVSPDDGSHTPLASWPELDPGTMLRRTVPLGAGDYRLWCSLEDHEAQGMSVQLRVE